MPDWIINYLQTKQLQIDLPSANLVAEYLGTNLSKVVNELDKLTLNVEAGQKITTKIIEANIGISRDYNVFELQKALGGRQSAKVYRIVQYFASNPKKHPLVVVVGSLYNYFSKVYMLHFLRNLPDKEVLAKMNLRSAYFLKDYRMAARNFNPRQTERVISVLHHYDLKSKGVEFNNQNVPDGDLLKEMVWKILNA